jgi:dihydrofolate reductase
MKLHLIFARARNGVIGHKGSMPWHLPEDLAHLKKTTMGCPVIMGRKTWDSLPPRFRPLPGRSNIVVTRQSLWEEQGALRAGSLDEAASICASHANVWVLGGAEIYAQALPMASTAVVTEIDADFEGDAYAPEFDARWAEVSREPKVAATGLHFSFVIYKNLQLS